MPDALPAGPPGHGLTCWFAGLTTLDVLHRAARRPGPNEKITALRQDVAAGGPAANAAVTAAALGVRAVLISAIGTGPVGATARGDLEAHGVEVLDTAPHPRFPLAVSAVLVDDVSGDRSVVSPDGALIRAGGAEPAPAPEQLAALPRPDMVLLDGHHPALVREVLAFVDRLSPRPRVLLDAGRWRPVFADLLPAADVAACSADFAVPADVTLASPRGLVVTHGPDPVEWRDGQTSGTVPVAPVEVRDTLGAGDAFHGALTVALARGDDLAAACRFAVAVASRRVTHVGPRSWLADLADLRQG